MNKVGSSCNYNRNARRIADHRQRRRDLLRGRNIGVALASAHQLDPATTNEPKITQIAEALAGKRPPSEILKAIIQQRRSFDMTELVELLDRAKELQAEAEELQRKAAILMEVLEEMVKSAC